MASKPPSRAPSSAPSKAATSFVWSLGLLVLAVGVFVVVFWMGRDKAPEHVTEKPHAAATEAKSERDARRTSMRSAPGSESTGTAAPQTANVPVVPQGTPPPYGRESEDTLANDPEVQRAISMIDAGNVTEAVALLETILKANPKNENALVELSMIYLLDLKQPEQAMGYLQRVLDVNPNNQVVLSELVSLYEEQGKLDEGLTYMQEVASRNPNSPDLAYGIGQMLSLQGRDAEAIQYLERAAQSPENQVRAYRDLAEAYSRSGDAAQSIETYNKAIGSQEREIAEKKAHGLPITFAEERLNYTKMDKARELIRAGDFEAAQNLVDEVSAAMPGDESVTALQDSINKRRAG